MHSYHNAQKQNYSQKSELFSANRQKTENKKNYLGNSDPQFQPIETQPIKSNLHNTLNVRPGNDFSSIPAYPKAEVLELGRDKLLKEKDKPISSLQKNLFDPVDTKEADKNVTPIYRNTMKYADPVQSSPSPEFIKTYSKFLSQNFTATIRQVDKPIEFENYSPDSREYDSIEEGIEDLPVIQAAEGTLIIRENDSVAPTITYTPNISQSATAPGASEFGVTTTTPSVSGISIVNDAASHTFNVTATLNNSITWSVHSCGRTNIPDENAAAINTGNYATVAADLTPNMASDNGRPPRRLYWAQDLTERHEQFHANERAHTYGRPAFDFAIAWLTAQSASTVPEVRAHVIQLPNKMRESYAASYSPGKESRAYGDGAPLYLARATAITTKGTTGGYGPAPAPPAAPRP